MAGIRDTNDLSPLPSRGVSLPRPANAPSLVELRQLLAERFPSQGNSTGALLATGLPGIDESIGGGLPRSSITELTSPNISAGSAFLIHALLRNAARDRYFVALVDGEDSFDPQSLGNGPLRNLLWVRCTKTLEAVKAADLLLRDGNFPLVILDLVLNAPEELRSIPGTTWYRLQRLVETAPTAFLVLTRRSMISSAQLKLSLDNTWKFQDLDAEDLTPRVRIRVTRGLHGREIMAGAG